LVSRVLLVAGIFVCGATAQVVHFQTNLSPPGFVPINGLVSTQGGITFTFADTSGADYDASNGGNVTYTQDPVIEGQTAGEVLTVSYSIPIYTVQFGLTVSTNTFPIPTMATVTLFNGSQTLGSFPVAALCPSAAAGCKSPPDAFSNGQFNYSGSLGPITKMTVAMNSAPATAFGFGNLIVSGTPISVPAATPTTLSFLGLGLAAIAVFLQRKQLQS
jgi:hypothetical protein